MFQHSCLMRWHNTIYINTLLFALYFYFACIMCSTELQQNFTCVTITVTAYGLLLWLFFWFSRYYRFYTYGSLLRLWIIDKYRFVWWWKDCEEKTRILQEDTHTWTSERSSHTTQQKKNDSSYCFFVLVSVGINCNILTTMPHVNVMPRPQYVFGTISPYPTHRNVIAVSQKAFNMLANSSSCWLR